MNKQLLLFLFFFGAAAGAHAQQEPLPAITVRNLNNKIIVSWVNNYTKPVTTLNIQRSYDSLKNYTTIGTVLSPQSRENGYVDANFPYNKMYYRVFVSFEGGSYIITPSARPVKDTTGSSLLPGEKYPWLADPNIPEVVTPVIPGVPGVPVKPVPPVIVTSVFTTRDNNVVIHLPDYGSKRYTIKFFDETEKMLFELTTLKEEYLILEKVNFGHTGNFRYELYEDGLIKENNRFRIEKEAKKL